MSEAAGTASTPLLELNGARATIRLNRPKHLNRLQPDDLDALLTCSTGSRPIPRSGCWC